MNTESKIKKIRERFTSLTDEILNEMIVDIDLVQYPQLKSKYLKIIPTSMKIKISCESTSEDYLFQNLSKEITNALNKYEHKKYKIIEIKKKLLHYDELLKIEEKTIEGYNNLSAIN